MGADVCAGMCSGMCIGMRTESGMLLNGLCMAAYSAVYVCGHAALAVNAARCYNGTTSTNAAIAEQEDVDTQVCHNSIGHNYIGAGGRWHEGVPELYRP